MKIVGVQYAWQKQNKKLFSCLKFQHTNVEDNTNAHSVEKNPGCWAEDHQLKLYIDQNSDHKLQVLKKFCDTECSTWCNFF